MTEIFCLSGMKSFRDDLINRMKTGWERFVLASFFMCVICSLHVWSESSSSAHGISGQNMGHLPPACMIIMCAICFLVSWASFVLCMTCQYLCASSAIYLHVWSVCASHAPCMCACMVIGQYVCHVLPAYTFGILRTCVISSLPVRISMCLCMSVYNYVICSKHLCSSYI